jgi:hypothetical protein
MPVLNTFALLLKMIRKRKCMWIDAVTAAIDKGMSLEEAQDKITLLDQYPMMAKDEHMAQVRRMNIARLYEVLKR